MLVYYAVPRSNNNLTRLLVPFFFIVGAFTHHAISGRVSLAKG